MKTFLIAGGLAVAALAAPQIAMASERASLPAASPDIVVTAEHQRNWDRGNRMEADGLRDMQKARESLVRYSADVVDAQDKRDTSASRAQNARDAFENLTARPFFTDAEEARDWAKQVEEAASDWERFEERSAEGARDLTRAQRRQATAQEDVEKAQAKIDEGRAMMAEAERLSQSR